VEGGKLSFQDTVDADSGQLFLEYGSAVLPYGHRDCIFFCGNTFHCPLPLNPATATTIENKKRKQGGEKKVELCRYSVASFLGKL
jgi:hypothetical protein